MNPSSSASTVSADLQMQVVLDDDNRISLPVVMAYEAQDPYAMSATFHTGDGEITWVFARDLLRDGLANSVGEGDILIRPAHPSRGPLVLFTLSSPSGAAKLEGNRHELRRFVKNMYNIVPEGCEWQYLQVDQVIGELLAEG